jgi:hypothetical protein
MYRIGDIIDSISKKNYLVLVPVIMAVMFFAVMLLVVMGLVRMIGSALSIK